MVLQATLTLSYHVITHKPVLLQTLTQSWTAEKVWIGQAVSAS